MGALFLRFLFFFFFRFSRDRLGRPFWMIFVCYHTLLEFQRNFVSIAGRCKSEWRQGKGNLSKTTLVHEDGLHETYDVIVCNQVEFPCLSKVHAKSDKRAKDVLLNGEEMIEKHHRCDQFFCQLDFFSGGRDVFPCWHDNCNEKLFRFVPFAFAYFLVGSLPNWQVLQISKSLWFVYWSVSSGDSLLKFDLRCLVETAWTFFMFFKVASNFYYDFLKLLGKLNSLIFPRCHQILSSCLKESSKFWWQFQAVKFCKFRYASVSILYAAETSTILPPC